MVTLRPIRSVTSYPEADADEPPRAAEDEAPPAGADDEPPQQAHRPSASAAVKISTTIFFMKNAPFLFFHSGITTRWPPNSATEAATPYTSRMLSAFTVSAPPSA